MPAISLVVCVYRQRDLLQRLLEAGDDFYDELLVSHDGPDVDDVKSVVAARGGRFFERPRIGMWEGHGPSDWRDARHDWILRLDADEIPSVEMKSWLKEFRQAAEPPPEVSGYTCVWPMWDGQREITKKIFAGRIFLFDRRRVRFFAMGDQVPIPDGHYQAQAMILHHQPKRKSYGLLNVLWRKQAYRWRAVYAKSLLGKPTDLSCWRWTSETWPNDWEQIRRHPLRTAVHRLLLGTYRSLRDQWRQERKLWPLAAMANPVHQALLCLKYWQLRRQQRSQD